MQRNGRIQFLRAMRELDLEGEACLIHDPEEILMPRRQRTDKSRRRRLTFWQETDLTIGSSPRQAAAIQPFATEEERRR